MQKRKAKDRVHLSMHESELEVIIPALFTFKRVLEQQVIKSYESANATQDAGIKALHRSVASNLSSQCRAIDRITKQL